MFGHAFHLKKYYSFVSEEKNSINLKRTHFQKISKNLQNFIDKRFLEKKTQKKRGKKIDKGVESNQNEK